MRTLCKINWLAFAAVLIIVTGCASNHPAKTARENAGQTRSDVIANTHPEGMIGPEGCIKGSANNNTHWWEYAFMPITTGCGLLLWYNDLPGIAR